MTKADVSQPEKRKQVKHTGWPQCNIAWKEWPNFYESQQILKHLQINHYASFTWSTFLFKECTPFSCKQKPLQLHTPFIYKSLRLITAATHTQLLTTKLLLCLAMPLSFCNHLNKSLPTPCCFTLLVFVHRLLTMSSFVMHYVPPYVDPSHPPVTSHSTLLFWVASSQRGACASGIEEV